ncbi:hypothetical protein ABW20_dc0103949 [Dactylellina cionopaga]|nr:hypothetical protein ABW20_dc0103949 [Dactylellina cionopaga]
MVELKHYDGHPDYYLWKYLPSLPAAVVFLLLFTGITGLHCWRMFKTRTWFCIAFGIGGMCQIIGYGVRIYCYYYTNKLAPFAIQNCLILLAPIFYAASIYMVLGRLIRSVHGDRFSIIRPTRLTKWFVFGDILSLNIQGNGAGLTVSKSTKLKNIGTYIVIVGLFAQLVAFGIFVAAAVVFHSRMRKDVKKKTSEPNPLANTVPWRQGLMMLYACSVFIIVRSIFRAIEYIQGVDGYLLTTAWPMYVFDASLMFFVQLVFFTWYPDKVQPREPIGSEDGHELRGNEAPTQ